MGGGGLYYYALGVRGFSNDYAAWHERVKLNSIYSNETVYKITRKVTLK